MYKKILLITILILAAIPTFIYAQSMQTLTIMTHDSFSISKNTVKAFEGKNNATLRFLKAGNAGAVVNKAILSKNSPMADILFGVDNTFMTRALEADIFEPYNSLALEDIYDFLKLDNKNRVVPVDYGDVCLNFDIKWFKDNNITPPKQIEDILEPEYKSLTVVQNPATSSVGLSFMLATVSSFGENGFIDFWKKLSNNDVLITEGWTESYWGKFTAASNGDRPIVVSYGTSPAAEVYFSKKPLNFSPTDAVVAGKSAFRQIEFVGILKGTQNLLLAQKMIDFMLQKTFQEDIPLQMFVFPASKKAEIPDVFKRYAKTAQNPAYLSPETIDKKRQKWIRDWTQAVLR